MSTTPLPEPTVEQPALFEDDWLSGKTCNPNAPEDCEACQ